VRDASWLQKCALVVEEHRWDASWLCGVERHRELGARVAFDDWAKVIKAHQHSNLRPELEIRVGREQRRLGLLLVKCAGNRSRTEHPPLGMAG
jgi:hypothetical protein